MLEEYLNTVKDSDHKKRMTEVFGLGRRKLSSFRRCHKMEAGYVY